ncbi:MAG TPA: VOC family protein [Longimicrobiales bacterium]|nr:VOC family protein [Longimicrobiales bacterium]
MTTLNGRELNVSLTVDDLAKSLAWYRDVVGFTVQQEYRRDDTLIAASLQAGNVRFLIGQDDGARGVGRVKGEGFSMQIITNDDIDALAQRIKEHGVTLDTEPTDTPWGARMFRVRDLDGFKLVISSDPAHKQR